MHLLHISAQHSIRWVVDLPPLYRHLDPLQKLQDHQAITQVPVEVETHREEGQNKYLLPASPRNLNNSSVSACVVSLLCCYTQCRATNAT